MDSPTGPVQQSAPTQEEMIFTFRTPQQSRTHLDGARAQDQSDASRDRLNTVGYDNWNQSFSDSRGRKAKRQTLRLS
jgi:hypothetical protein